MIMNGRERTRPSRFRPVPNLQDGDLRLLRVFVSVVRNRGFSAAQTELNIGQSTICGYIAKLEYRLASPRTLVRNLNSKRFNAIILPVFRPLTQTKVITLEQADSQILYCARNHPLYGKSPGSSLCRPHAYGRLVSLHIARTECRRQHSGCGMPAVADPFGAVHRVPAGASCTEVR